LTLYNSKHRVDFVYFVNYTRVRREAKQFVVSETRK